jgi:hypothetical protein
MTRYDHGRDVCLSLWADAYASGRFDFPPNARVLEIGCAEADWMTPMLALRPDLDIIGIDWRKTKRPGTTIKGDVLTHEFEPDSFDCIVGISSIEHIGLGHYDADPKADEGDIRCMERVAEWLKPGGWAYLDVPFNANGYFVKGTKCRVYDSVSALARLSPLPLRPTEIWFADRDGTVVPSLPPRPQPDFDYVALLLTKP